MSVTGKRGVGIPVILLHDAEGGIVTVELKDGHVYRGLLEEAQDSMNCTMKVLYFLLYSLSITV
jgi:small nuclear ribonucleoprotein D3